MVEGGGERGRGRLFWSETFQSLFGAQSQNFLKDTSRYFFRMFCFAGFVRPRPTFDPSGGENGMRPHSCNGVSEDTTR